MTATTSEWECVACGEKTGTNAERPCRCEREAAKAALPEGVSVKAGV